MTLSNNPYQVIAESEPKPKSSDHVAVILMLPFALFAGLAGGYFQTLQGFQILGHPMVPAALVFGIGAGCYGLLCRMVIPSQARRWWRQPIQIVLPILTGVVFDVTGRMLDASAQWMARDPGLWSFFGGLLGSGILGMAMLAACLVLSGLLPIRLVVPFIAVASTLGAVCVAVVNQTNFGGSVLQRLFWTMFAWQAAMLIYLATLAQRANARTKVT